MTIQDVQNLLIEEEIGESNMMKIATAVQFLQIDFDENLKKLQLQLIEKKF